MTIQKNSTQKTPAAFFPAAMLRAIEHAKAEGGKEALSIMLEMGGGGGAKPQSKEQYYNVAAAAKRLGMEEEMKKAAFGIMAALKERAKTCLGGVDYCDRDFRGYRRAIEEMKNTAQEFGAEKEFLNSVGDIIKRLEQVAQGCLNEGGKSIPALYLELAILEREYGSKEKMKAAARKAMGLVARHCALLGEFQKAANIAREFGIKDRGIAEEIASKSAVELMENSLDFDDYGDLILTDPKSREDYLKYAHKSGAQGLGLSDTEIRSIISAVFESRKKMFEKEMPMAAEQFYGS